ncbi:MAG: DUF5522 domain-containing protein [Bdellovibrionota bacterium]
MNNDESETLYYFNEEGLLVMTEAYHLKRGYCCESGCLHCPYGYKCDRDNVNGKGETNFEPKDQKRDKNRDNQ